MDKTSLVSDINSPEKRIFDGVVYFLNPALGPTRCAELDRLLRENGATEALTPLSRPAAAAAEHLSDDESTQDGSTQDGTAQDKTTQDEEADDMGPGMPRFDPARTTHVVTADEDFPEREAIREAGIAVVTPLWIEKAIRNKFTHSPEFYSPDPTKIFSGVVVATSGLPKNDREALFGGVSAFGGQFRPGLTNDVTHLVCLAPEGVKYRKVMESPELGIKVVLPHWFDDCFKLKRLIRERMYLFPEPPLLRPDLWAGSESNSATATTTAAVAATVTPTVTTNTHTTNTLSLLPSSSQPQPSSGTAPAPAPQPPPPVSTPASVNIDSLTTTPNEAYIFPVPSSATPIPEPSSTFLKGMRFYLCGDLHNRALRATFEERLKQAGAVVVSQGSPYRRKEVDCFVGKYREGDAYIQACRDGKVVGSLFWLQHMFHTERMENPKDQLLDYPQPKEKIPEFENFVITISNYTGAAREYVKRLIHNLGGAYTPHMTPANTHVICASPTGDKYAKALEWNTHVVNHLWLEECYQSWTCRSVADARYTYFTEGVKMEDLIGRTPVLSVEVERWWKPLPEEEGESTEESDVHGRRRPESQLVSDDAGTDPLTATRPRPLGTGSVTTVSKQPRQAALQAADALHELYMPDAVAYEKEKRTPRGRGMRASSVGNVGKRERDDEERGEEDTEEVKRKAKTNKRNRMEDDEDAAGEEARDDMEEEEAEQGELEDQRDLTLSKVTPRKDKGGKKAVVARPRSASVSESANEKTKKGRKVNDVVDTSANTTPTKGGAVRVLTTGYKLSEKDKKFLKSMGARLADTPHECTHLIAKQVARTEKFLSCVSVAQYILKPDWIAESIVQGHLVDETPYTLKDSNAEKQYQFKLTTSLERAREGKLMEGIEVYVTPKTHPSKETVKEIVECAGGKLITTISSRKLRDSAASNSLIILSCEEDRDRWKEFKVHGLPIHSPELLLVGVLRQELDLDTKEFKLAG